MNTCDEKYIESKRANMGNMRVKTTNMNSEQQALSNNNNTHTQRVKTSCR